MGKGGSSTRLPAGLDALSLIQAGGARKSIGLRNEVFQQVQDALAGKTKNIPLVQQGVRAAQQATEQSLQGARTDIERRNITGPFGARELAQVRQTGEQAAAAVPSQVIQQLLQMGPALSQVGYPGSAVSGSSSETTPDTASPAIGAGAAVAAAAIVAI